jgi:hypothetical protein
MKLCHCVFPHVSKDRSGLDFNVKQLKENLALPDTVVEGTTILRSAETYTLSDTSLHPRRRESSGISQQHRCENINSCTLRYSFYIESQSME